MYNKGDPSSLALIHDKIRGFIADIVRIEEIETYIAKGLLRDRDDWMDIMHLAKAILTHQITIT